jgi:hypothetical protein
MTAMTVKRGRASNGASVTTYIGEAPGPHTLVVAGQHGHEVGPIAALLGWVPSLVTHGIVTIIRCANVSGADTGVRLYRAGGEALDMGRGWGGGEFDQRPQPLCAEFVDEIRYAAGRPPDVVVDLHSGGAEPSRRRHAFREGIEPGLTVVVPLLAVGTCSSETRLTFARLEDYTGQPSPSAALGFRAMAELNSINEQLGAVAPARSVKLDHFDGGWEVACIHQPGALADASVAHDVAAITVVFASDLPHRVPPSPAWERPYGSGARRQRTLAEATRGVREFVDWLVLPNCRTDFERVASSLGLPAAWVDQQGWHTP